MAITVEYGPISTALNLARQSGEGIRKQRAQQQASEFQQLIAAQQEQQARQRATAISQALAQNQQSFQNQQSSQAQQLAEQRQQQLEQYQTQQLALQQRQQQAQEANAAVRQEQGQSAIELKKQEEARRALTFGEKETALNALPQDQEQLIRAQGHLPSGQNQDTTRSLAAEYRRLTMVHRQAEKDLQAASFDENDMKKFGTLPSETVPGAIKGMEDRYNSAKQTVAQLQSRLSSVDQAITQATPVQGQGAPATQPRIVQTATNPQTGQRVGFDANTGQWVAIGQ